MIREAYAFVAPTSARICEEIRDSIDLELFNLYLVNISE